MSETHPPPPIELRNPYAAALLAWLLPGMGHFYQGRNAKGALYFICIVGLFVAGLMLSEFKVVYWEWVNPRTNPESFRFPFLAQMFVGLPALPALIQGTLQYNDVGPLFGGFMAKPDLAVLNALQQRQGKLFEIGAIYTMVAGLLNILAIFDAFGGPAYLAFEGHRSAKEQDEKTVRYSSPPSPSDHATASSSSPSSTTTAPTITASDGSDRKETPIKLEAPLAS